MLSLLQKIHSGTIYFRAILNVSHTEEVPTSLWTTSTNTATSSETRVQSKSDNWTICLVRHNYQNFTAQKTHLLELMWNCHLLFYSRNLSNRVMLYCIFLPQRAGRSMSLLALGCQDATRETPKRWRCSSTTTPSSTSHWIGLPLTMRYYKVQWVSDEFTPDKRKITYYDIFFAAKRIFLYWK